MALVGITPGSQSEVFADLLRNKTVEEAASLAALIASPTYEADDGMITYEQIEAIKKFVPQVNFYLAKSLF